MAIAASVGSGPRLRSVAIVVMPYSVNAGTVIVSTTVLVVEAVSIMVLVMLVSNISEGVKAGRTCAQ